MTLKSLAACREHGKRWWPLWFAAVFTAGFVWWVCTLALEVTVQGEISASRWNHFLGGRPNELGDTLAGFVGSLTLIWVIASVFQQSMELRAQRREFSEMAAAQAEQVQALKAQTAILVDEKTRRDQLAVGEYIEEHLKTVAKIFCDREVVLMRLSFRLAPPDGALTGPETYWNLMSGVDGDLEDYETILYDVGCSLEKTVETLDGITKRGGQLLEVPNALYKLKVVIGSAAEIEKAWYQLSPAFKEKVFRSKVFDSGKALERVFSILDLGTGEGGTRK